MHLRLEDSPGGEPFLDGPTPERGCQIRQFGVSSCSRALVQLPVDLSVRHNIGTGGNAPFFGGFPRSARRLATFRRPSGGPLHL